MAEIGKALADAGALVDFFVFAGDESDALDDLLYILGQMQARGGAGRFGAGGAIQPGFLRGDGDSLFDGGGIVGANLAADAVFERRDDFAARGVVLGIGA